MLPHFQPGDIVVCARMPGLSDDAAGALVTASAIVTGSGIGSNAVMFAMKRRIPCVAGIEEVTSLIQDGQTITVDGDHGIVKIES